MGQINTVTGTISAEQLGVTLPHEHALLDLTCLWDAPQDPARRWLVDEPVRAELFEILQDDPYHNLDNLRLDDVPAVMDELKQFQAAGGHTVVDLSTLSIGPYPRELGDLSRGTGLNIVAGTGFYVRSAHPDWVQDAPCEVLYEHMLRDLTEGFPGSGGIKAGIIGELGTGSPIHPTELKVLEAAVRVQREHPVAINVHLAIFASQGLHVLDALESFGADLTRVALSHLDENLDSAYHLALAERGVYLEFDTFGSECRFSEDGSREPTDAERLAALSRLMERGYGERLLISQDVCTKMQWSRHGGKGYAHVLTTIVPQLLDAGLSRAEVDQIIRVNPARLLGGK